MKRLNSWGIRVTKQIVCEALFILVCGIAIFYSIEYGLSYGIINSTGTVTEKQLSVPEQPGESIFLITVHRFGHRYQFRVQKAFFDVLERSDKVLLIDRRGFLTDRILETSVYDSLNPENEVQGLIGPAFLPLLQLNPSK